MTLFRPHVSSESLGLLCGKCQSANDYPYFYVLMDNVKLTIQVKGFTSCTIRNSIILTVTLMLSSGFTLLHLDPSMVYSHGESGVMRGVVA